MQNRLAQHFLPAEAIVLGTKLRPFSLWHWRTLCALESPLLDGKQADVEGVAQFEDLALAVRICTLPPNASMRRLNRALRPGPLGRLWAAFHREYSDFEAHLDIWFQYFAHYAKGPKPLGEGGGGRSARVHPTIYLFAGLLQLGYSREDAWAESPGMARWLIAGGAECAGDQLEIVSDAMIRQAVLAGFTEEDMEL